MQKLLQASKGAFAQAATNEFRALTQNATNQSQAALASTTPVAVAGTNQVQALLEKAKSLTQNQKYQEALTNLTQLYNSKLTPEQKQKADDLKAQVQAGLAKKATEEATSVLGNILGGKKE